MSKAKNSANFPPGGKSTKFFASDISLPFFVTMEITAGGQEFLRNPGRKISNRLRKRSRKFLVILGAASTRSHSGIADGNQEFLRPVSQTSEKTIPNTAHFCATPIFGSSPKCALSNNEKHQEFPSEMSWKHLRKSQPKIGHGLSRPCRIKVDFFAESLPGKAETQIPPGNRNFKKRKKKKEREN